MNCDDQVRVVKRDHNPNTLAPNPPDIPPVSVAVEIDLLGGIDQPFDIRDRRTDVASPVFGMPREAHLGLSHERANLSPWRALSVQPSPDADFEKNAWHVCTQRSRVLEA